MAAQTTQTFENHVRILPAFHYVTLPLILINFLYAVYQALFHFGVGTVMALVVAFALILVALFSRMMTITVQDRLIRLEERMRMRTLLPADLQGRIEEFGVKQLVALRFASDAELPALARKVLDEKIQDQKSIKKLVQHWRADYQRA